MAKGMWIRRQAIDPNRLVDYALRLDVSAVIRRVGFLMEVCETCSRKQSERLRERLTATYHLLDPTLPNDGRYLARWRLRLNVTREEIEAGRSV